MITAAALWAAVVLLFPSTGMAKVFLSIEEALKQAHPGAAWEKETVYLSREEAKAIHEETGSKPTSRVVYRYLGIVEGHPVAAAYLDRHPVRTLPETLLIVTGPAGEVKKVRLLLFSEPEEYMLGDAWLQRLAGPSPGRPLKPGRDIDGITGATLSVRAAISSVNRIRMIDRLHSVWDDDGDNSSE